MRQLTTSLALASVLLVATLATCEKVTPSGPLRLKAIQLGGSVDEESRIVSPSSVFTPESTVYASIRTEGSGTGTLSVRWVDVTGKPFAPDESRVINPTKPSYFAFHFIPPERWPTGTNRIVFSLDEDRNTAEFQIR